MRRVLVVLDAKRFDHVRIREQKQVHLLGERFRIELGIVDRDEKVHVAEVAPVEPLGERQP